MKNVIESLKNIKMQVTEVVIGEIEVHINKQNKLYLFQSKIVTAWIEDRALVCQNDDNCYNPYKLNFSGDAGSDRLFNDVYALNESEIENMNEVEFNEFNEHHDFESKEQLLELYLVLCDAIGYLAINFYSELDIDDYIIEFDRLTGEYSVTRG